MKVKISIHALYAEGDLTAAGFQRTRAIISIHALYAEGDRFTNEALNLCQIGISIHALYAEGDAIRDYMQARISISIHALYAEGDNDPRIML